MRQGRIIRRSTIGFTIAAALALTSCGGAKEAITEEIVERAAGGSVDVEVDGDGEVVKVETKDGSVSITGDGKLPDAWPDDVPTYDGGRITGSQTAEGGDEQVVSVQYESDEAGKDIVAALRPKLEAAGFTIEGTSQTEGAGAVSILAAKRGEQEVSLIATTDPDGKTNLNLAVSTPAGS